MIVLDFLCKSRHLTPTLTFSVVHDVHYSLPPRWPQSSSSRITALTQTAKKAYFSIGPSLVAPPCNPPTLGMRSNYRYFEPFYDDDTYDPGPYADSKAGATNIFSSHTTVRHTGSSGIFFDGLCDAPHNGLPDTILADRLWTQETTFEIVRVTGGAFLPSYIPIQLHGDNTEGTPQCGR
ncbi:hypothetical protein BJY52DRAFT_1186733 [Lactarius psammicola]|nr:hypothetical protein BJY52DRAFT_1186733 [Lactarius psammicola]